MIALILLGCALLHKEIGSNRPYHANIKDGITRKSRSSKQFGIANDASDHHFFHKTSHVKQATLFYFIFDTFT